VDLKHSLSSISDATTKLYDELMLSEKRRINILRCIICDELLKEQHSVHHTFLYYTGISYNALQPCTSISHQLVLNHTQGYGLSTEKTMHKSEKVSKGNSVYLDLCKL